MILEAISQAAPDQAHRHNEDAFIAYQRDDGQPRYILAAIDGATSLLNFAPLKYYLDSYRNSITPAGLAATITRDAILAQLGNLSPNDDLDPRHLLLEANHALRWVLDEVAAGIYNADEILALHPDDANILNDPRKIRLYLPAAVISLATIDTEVGFLRFAHAGDTALMIAYEDGRVEVPTGDERHQVSYESALAMASQALSDQHRTMLDAINDPLIRALDRDHRIYHNFVDEYGQTSPERGIGVVDGLPELADYIKTGMLVLEGVEAVMLMSDGFLWPAPLHESQTARQARYTRMWAQIRQFGLPNYLAALRAEERADASREKYPRFKLHDDATVVSIRRI